MLNFWHEDESVCYCFAYFITKMKCKHLNAQRDFSYILSLILVQITYNLLFTYKFLLMQLTLIIITFKICTMLPDGNQKCTCLQVVFPVLVLSCAFDGLKSPRVCITVCCSSAEAQRPVGTPRARTGGVSAVVPHNCLYGLGHKSPKLLADMPRHHLSVHTWMSLPYR